MRWLLKEDGGRILLEDGTGALLLEQDVAVAPAVGLVDSRGWWRDQRRRPPPHPATVVVTGVQVWTRVSRVSPTGAAAVPVLGVSARTSLGRVLARATGGLHVDALPPLAIAAGPVVAAAAAAARPSGSVAVAHVGSATAAGRRVAHVLVRGVAVRMAVGRVRVDVGPDLIAWDDEDVVLLLVA